jgi:hypothetical protein
MELAATDDFNLACGIKVIKPDGSDRGIVLAVTASDDVSATPPEMATSATNRKLRDASENTSITLSNVSVSTGDRLVIEIGFRQDSTSANTCSIDVGFTAAGSDLAEDDSSTSGEPWVEFSKDIIFCPEWIDKSAAVPVSGGSNATATITLTPPSTMQKGDLCVVFCESRVSATWSIGVTGGQTWTSETAFQGSSNPFCRVFWCTFNGTWSANPRFDSTSSTCTSAVMQVIQSSTQSDRWEQDIGQATTQFAAPGSPFTVTRNGVTTIADCAVALAAWFSADDNSWGSISGTGWELLNNSYNNLAQQDQSMAIANYTASAPGATGNVSLNEDLNGGDAGVSFIMAWKDMAQSLIFDPAPMQPFLVR